MEYLRIGNKVIEYELYKSTKAKRVCITIKNQLVKVAVPSDLSFEYAKFFLENNKGWVLKTLQKQQNKAKSLQLKKYLAGEKFLYRGRNYPLVIEKTPGPEFYTIFKGSRIVTYVPPDLSPREQSLMVKNLIEKWYRGQAENILPEQVDYYSKLLALPYKKLKIKDQKTRWGSCSAKKNINLNWRIIMAPNQVIAYVIIHELTHLRYMNHSQQFWDTVEHYLPDYKKWKTWLAENGKELTLAFEPPEVSEET
jgi:predicted metal-dependent hydrolase